MKQEPRKPGYTLAEMLIVIASITVLVGIGVPAVRALFNSFESTSGSRAVISAALASARAIAAREQRYVGVRFQKAFNPDDPLNPFAESQYMVFIIHDYEKTGYAAGFRAVRGIKPIKLPDSVGVMDHYYRADYNNDQKSDFLAVGSDADILVPAWSRVRDLTTFCIIFAPSGKLMIHDVRVMRTGAGDDVFNEEARVELGTAQFIQDSHPGLGLGQEVSRTGFIIYDRRAFKQAYEKGRPYSGYLQSLLPEIPINPYTGTVIWRD